MFQTKKFVLIIFLSFISTCGFAQGNGNDKNDNGNANPGGPRTNKLLPHGNIGIGTLTPSEKLEVVGNVLVSDHLRAKEITAVGFNATNISVSNDLKVGNNILVEGNVGIGVLNPTEKLDVAGNIRVSRDITSDRLFSNQLNAGLANISTDLAVGNNLLVNGNTGLGVASPTVKLDVAGSIKASSNLTVEQHATILGNVGIGVSAPTEQLEVAGNIKSRNLYTNDMYAANGYFSGNIGLGIEAPEEKLHVKGNVLADGFTGTNGNFSNVSSTSLANSGSINTGSLIAQEEIKATSLTIQESALFNKDARVYGTITSANIKAEQVNASKANVTGDLLVNKNGTVSGDFQVAGKLTAGSILAKEIKTENNASLNIMDPVAVGIEHVPAGYQMAVNGNMLTTTVEVMTYDTWPDYVFADGYVLLPLEQVKDYIQHHGHLPNIPSAEEIKKNGYSLSEMDAHLLEKIEELTLYMIEMKQENALLKKEIELLRNSR